MPFLVSETQQAAFAAKVGANATLVSIGRRNEKLVESITSVRIALVRDFWQDRLDFPEEDHEMWWEVWLRGTRATAADVHERFQTLAGIVGICASQSPVRRFPGAGRRPRLRLGKPARRIDRSGHDVRRAKEGEGVVYLLREP